MIYVFTANVGGFDNLRTPACAVPPGVRFLCFTDLPVDVLPKVYPWEYVKVDRLPSGPRTSRAPKILAHKYLPADAEYSIYHDCNFQLRVDPNEITAEVLGPEQWAAHRHPARDCVYDEAQIVIRDCPLVNSADVEREIGNYRANAFPQLSGLWANGFIVRRHTPETAALNELWWDLYSAGSERDQLSFPVARRQLGVPVRSLGDNVFSSRYILFRWHAAWKDKGDNPDYWAQRASLRAQLAGMGIPFPAY